MLAFKPLNVYLYHLIYAILMKKQSKTPLFGTIRKAFQMAIAAQRRQTSAEEIVQINEANRQSRRHFLEQMGKTALVGGLVSKQLLPSGTQFVFDNRIGWANGLI